MITIKKSGFVIFFLLLSVMTSLVMSFDVFAYVSGVRGEGYGYFDSSHFDGFGVHVLPPVEGTGFAIPPRIQTVDDLYIYLRDLNASGNANQVTGSAFIIYTMLGVPSPGRDRRVSGTDLADLYERLKDPKLTVDWGSSGKYVSYSINTYYMDNGDDDVAYDFMSSSESSNHVIQFIYDGNVVYQLRRKCANPVGGLSGLPEPEEDVVTPDPGTITACRPIMYTTTNIFDVHGNPVYTTVTLTNDETGQVITKGSHYPNSTINLSRDCTTGETWTITETSGVYINRHDVGCAPNGPYPCIPYHFDYWTTSGYFNTTKVGPCYDYEILPNAVLPQLTSSRNVEVDSIFSVRQSNETYRPWTQVHDVAFQNANRTISKSKKAYWNVGQIIIPANATVPTVSAVTGNTKNMCNYFESLPGVSAGSCQVVSRGLAYFDKNGSLVPGSENPFSSISLTAGDYSAGTKICFVSTFWSSSSDPTHYSHVNDNAWSHSPLSMNSCVKVVKKPKAQVQGGDLFAGRSSSNSYSVFALTSTKNVNGQPRVFGSWAEYAIFGSAVAGADNLGVEGMASGAAFSGDTGIAQSSNKCNYGTLTFSNSDSGNSCASVLGNYRISNTIPDIASNFLTTPGVNVSGSISLNGRQGVYGGTGNVTINASNIVRGQWVVLNMPSYDVTINGNITYSDGPYNSIGDIPQVVIIARNITIDSSVTNVDSWLIAKGTDSGSAPGGVVNTCTQGRDPSYRITVNDCNQLLTINGPVIANHLYLRRTAGSGPVDSGTSDDPAEIINLRADAYLWAYARSLGSGRVVTVYSTDAATRL